MRQTSIVMLAAGVLAWVAPAAGVAGTTDINGATLDMSGFDEVNMLVGFGVITAAAVTSIKAQQGQQSDGSDMADLAGTAITVADTDDEKVKKIRLIRPQERYVRVVVDRGTQNAVVALALYEQLGARKQPVTDGSNVASETHHSPVEGTA